MPTHPSPSSPLHAVQLQEVHFEYPGTPVLKGLTFTIESGQIYTLLGPNGAGKSTVQKLICGSLAPGRGQVRVLQHDPLTNHPGWRARLAWLGDQPAHHVRLTLLENLSFYADLYSIPRERCAQVLEQVGLAALQKRYPGTLSRGQQQRLGWARALLIGAELLLLDEPTNGLDLASKESIHQLIVRFRDQGGTVLLSTHDMSEAEALSDQVGLLADGRLFDQGTPQELCQRHLGQELPPAAERPGLERVYRLTTGRSLIAPSEP